MHYQLLLVLAICLPYASIAGRHLFQEAERNLHEESPSAYLLYPRTCEEAYANNPKAQESNSCSLGATKPFIGPLATWADIRAMLDARAHKGEVILTHETRLDIAAQWQWRMLRMGWGHTVVITRGKLSCEPLRELFGDNIGCVWFEYSVSHSSGGGGGDPGAGGPPRLLPPGQVALFLESAPYWKFQLVAMVLKVGGYNVLALDTDTIVMDDFYWWMQQPDYQGYHLLSQFDGMGTLNVGVMYFRGAAPGGPTAWSMAEGLLRNIRWREQPELLTRLNSSHHTCWDQSVLTDTVYSALAGRPIFWRCLDVRQLDRTWETREDGKKLFLATTEGLINPSLERKNFSMSRSGPSCHYPLEGPKGLFSREGRLRMPHFGGEWPDALGGPALGTSGQGGMGPLATAYLTMMREAGTPMWPDPEDPASQSAAAAVPPERFAFFSRHLVCDWSGCGMNGMYQTALRKPEEEPCVVIGHIVVSPDATPGKRFQLMANGAYSMALAAREAGPGAPFFATNPLHGGGSSTHHGAVRVGMMHGRRQQNISLPKVIALDPAALSPGPSPPSGSSSPLVLAGKQQLVELVAALGSVAVAAGRVLGLPRLSCDYPWMHRDVPFAFNGSHYVPWRYMVGEAFVPYGPALDRLSCEWFAWVQDGCLHGPLHGRAGVTSHPAARMLLSYEMEYLVSQLPDSERSPSTSTSTTSDSDAGTVDGAVSPDPGRNLVTVPPGAVAGPDGVFNITTEQLQQQLAGMAEDRTVVWLERPMRVVDLSGPLLGSHEHWVRHCCGLSWPHGFNHICFWNF